MKVQTFKSHLIVKSRPAGGGAEYRHESLTEGSYEQLCQKLRNGVAHFFFRKKDGTIREAFGTTSPELIPVSSAKDLAALLLAADNMAVTVEKAVESPENFAADTTPLAVMAAGLRDALHPYVREKKTKKQSEAVQVFFDLNIQEWRSFVITDFLYYL